MKVIILKIVRAMASFPLILFLGSAVYSGIFGIGLKDSVSTGLEAIVLVLLIGGAGFWWLWLICIVLIIITSVLIGKASEEPGAK